MTEQVNARKESIGIQEAIELARSVDDIYVAKGKSVVHINRKRDKPDDETLRRLLSGPTGNLRAPALRKGRTLIVGFDPQMYRSVLG